VPAPYSSQQLSQKSVWLVWCLFTGCGPLSLLPQILYLEERDRTYFIDTDPIATLLSVFLLDTTIWGHLCMLILHFCKYIQLNFHNTPEQRVSLSANDYLATLIYTVNLSLQHPRYDLFQTLPAYIVCVYTGSPFLSCPYKYLRWYFYLYHGTIMVLSHIAWYSLNHGHVPWF
jgi:hypothetical protein